MLLADLDVPDQNILAELKNASDQDFDYLYPAQHKDAHQQALALFQSYADNGDEATLKKLAQDMLAAIEQHLDRVASLISRTQVALNSNKESHKQK
jgi:putative membrane protein